MHTTPLLPNLPPAVSREVFATLCATLPPPVPDTPEARAERTETAMTAVAALHPADAFEALLAAQIVGTDAHAKDCLRLAVQSGQDLMAASRCRAQAAAMLRQMQASLRSLLRIQATREKADAAMQPAAMERAGYWFRDASVPASEPPAAPQPDIVAKAEIYAAANPERAAGIRATGGLPNRLDFTPPAPEIVTTLVNGSSTIPRALEHIVPAGITP